MHKLFFVVISKQQDVSNWIFPQRCAIFDKKIIRIQDHLLRLKTFKRAMKIENIYRLEFAFAFCFRICICVLLLSSSPGRKCWLGGKISTPRPGPLARIWNTSHLPAYQIYHLNLFTYHWLKEKGVDRIVFIYHPFFSCTQATKIEKTKYEPHPFHKAPLVK